MSGNQAAIAPNADLRHVEVMDRLARQLTAPDSEEEEGQERGSPGAEEPLEEEAERGDEEEGDQPLVMRRSRGQEDPYNKRQEITAGSATSKRRKADEDDGLGLRIGLGREDMGEMTLEGMTKEKRVCNRARDW